jgi:hypothetical protein
MFRSYGLLPPKRTLDRDRIHANSQRIAQQTPKSSQLREVLFWRRDLTLVELFCATPYLGHWWVKLSSVSHMKVVRRDSHSGSHHGSIPCDLDLRWRTGTEVHIRLRMTDLPGYQRCRMDSGDFRTVDINLGQSALGADVESKLDRRRSFGLWRSSLPTCIDHWLTSNSAIIMIS